MAHFSLAFNAAATVPLNLVYAPVWDAMAAATNRPAILETGFSLLTTMATVAAYGFGRSSNTPVQLGGIAPLPDDTADKPSVTTIAAAWSTAPALPTQFVRRITTGGLSAQGVIWSWRRGFVIPSSASAGLHVNGQSNGLSFPVAVHVVVNE